MNNVLEFLKSRSIAWFIGLAATLFGLIGFIVYLAAGTNEFAPSLSASVIVPLAIALLIGLFTAVKTFKLCMLVQYVLYLYAFGSYIVANVNLFANLAYGVDGSSLPIAFLLIAVFTLLAFVGSLTAGIMTKFGDGGVKKSYQAKEEV